MNDVKSTMTASALLIALSAAPAANAINSYASAENVITLDDTVVSIQRSLERKKYRPVSTVTNLTNYIVPPTERRYQTAETIITMVDKTQKRTIEFANVKVAIIYDVVSDSYSAGEVSVKYSKKQTRL